MIQKKSYVQAMKRALQNGVFNFVGQQASEIPPDLFKLDTMQFEDTKWWDCAPITKIDVSTNTIAALPPQISILLDLQVIRCRDNLLTQLPPEIWLLQSLKSLDVSKNKLKGLDKDVSTAKALVELNLAENQLEFCPHLAAIKTLELLNLSSNKLRDLPDCGPALKRLEASTNAISILRASTLNLCDQLEMLNLSKNVIETIEPGALQHLHQLTSLQFKQNRLVSFNQPLQSPRLDTLSFSFNRLKQFDLYRGMPNLTVLVLADNKLSVLSGEIVHLKKLKTLDLSNNDLSDLPPELGFLPALVRLQLEGNPLKSIRQAIRIGGTSVIQKYLKDKIDPDKKTKMENEMARGQSGKGGEVTEKQRWTKLIMEFTQSGQLALKGMNLTDVDAVLYEQVQIKILNLTGNKLSRLQPQLGNMQSLRSIILSQNAFQLLPECIGSIGLLETLQVKGNLLKTFPQGQFESLVHLDLCNNCFKAIPPSITKLYRLRTLLLGYNQLTSAEPLFEPAAVTRLEVLDVSNNKIVDISQRIFNRACLNYFSVQNNELKSLPSCIGFMKLTGCKIDGNPLKLIKRQVIDRGTVAILEHLRTKHVGDPPIPPPQPASLIVQKKFAPEKPNYPYETQWLEEKQRGPVSNQPPQMRPQQGGYQQAPPPNTGEGAVAQRIDELNRQISSMQREIDENIGLNRNQMQELKRKIQSMMIQRNRIMKE